MVPKMLWLIKKTQQRHNRRKAQRFVILQTGVRHIVRLKSGNSIELLLRIQQTKDTKIWNPTDGSATHSANRVFFLNVAEISMDSRPLPRGSGVVLPDSNRLKPSRWPSRERSREAREPVWATHSRPPPHPAQNASPNGMVCGHDTPRLVAGAAMQGSLVQLPDCLAVPWRWSISA